MPFFATYYFLILLYGEIFKSVCIYFSYVRTFFILLSFMREVFSEIVIVSLSLMVSRLLEKGVFLFVNPNI